MMKLLLIVFGFVSLQISAQTLDKFGTKEMVQINGGLNYSSNYFAVSGKPINRDPFMWTLGGNFNISLIDVSFPFTFSFTNQGSSYTQPMNFIAVHPSYKKLKSHIGTFSTSFSQYTLSGVNIAGAGIEYKPGSWSFQAVGGRFRKHVDYDPTLNNLSSIAFTRWGGGIMIGFEKKGVNISMNALKIDDDPSSLKIIPSNATIKPASNFTAGIKAKATLFKALNIESEVATSLITRNTDNPNIGTVSVPLASWVKGNQTTDQHLAVNGSANYRFKKIGLGVKYERVNPGYTTLGGMYFNNDLENYTITPTASLLKGKINVNANVGIQRNNIANTTSNATKRWVGSVSISSNPVKNLSLGLNFSNFSSYSKRNPAAYPLYNPIADTLNYYQISSNLSVNAAYQFGKKVKNSMSTSFMSSVSENITGRLDNATAFGFNVEGISQTGPTRVNASMFSHSFSKEKSKFGLGYTLNYTKTIAAQNSSQFFGPGATFSLPIPKKKINFSAGLVYNQNYLNQKLTNNVFTGRCGFSYTPEWWDKKYGKLNMALNANIINKIPVVSTQNNIIDFNLITTISYTF